MQKRRNGWNKSILTAILTETESFRLKSLKVLTTIYFLFCSLDSYCRRFISFYFFIAGTVFFVFDTAIHERDFFFLSHDCYLILIWPLNKLSAILTSSFFLRIYSISHFLCWLCTFPSSAFDIFSFLIKWKKEYRSLILYLPAIFSCTDIFMEVASDWHERRIMNVFREALMMGKDNNDTIGIWPTIIDDSCNYTLEHWNTFIDLAKWIKAIK